MTVNDIYKVIEGLRNSGYTDKDIARSFVNLFVTDKITIEQCNAMISLLGFHMPEEIMNATADLQKRYLIEFLNKK